MKRHLARAAAAVAAALLAACSSGNTASGQPELAAPAVSGSAASAAGEPADVADFLGRDDESGAMDCDAEDKAKKEVPDCGFYAGPSDATFYWWSWVTAGQSTPPAGWSAGREVEPYRPSSGTRRGRR